MEPTAALFYSWSIRYIVNRAPVTVTLNLLSEVLTKCGLGQHPPDKQLRKLIAGRD